MKKSVFLNAFGALCVALCLALPAAAQTADVKKADAPTPFASALAGLSWRSIGPANMGGRVADV